MPEQREDRGVVLPKGHTGSSLFHAVLADAAAAYPAALGEAEFPADAKRFKSSYGVALARFEAARTRAEERVDIARFVVDRTLEALRFTSEAGRIPLREHMASRAAPVRLTRARLGSAPALQVEVPFEGELLGPEQSLLLFERMHAAHQMTDAAHAALKRTVQHFAERGGTLDLRGQRFVLLGAGAELAPTRMLLRAGASVLWIDLADPARALSGEPLSGTLFQASANNLLEMPREVAAAIEQFAAEGPVHIGMFAYAAGASQEWRLGAAMNAIVTSLDPALVRSVALLVSPTTPSVLSAESVRAAELRWQSASWGERALAAVGALRRPGHYSAHDQHIALATVELQGLSYQAAQYISKIAAAETYAVYGARHDSNAGQPLTVSANVAGITRTRSLSHPLFEAAFAGADLFGVRIFEPTTTRAVSGLLMLHDLLQLSPAPRDLSARERAALLHTRQMHGGIYGLPCVLEGVIRAAAIAGLARKPSVLRKKRPRPEERAPLALDMEEVSARRPGTDAQPELR